MFAWIGSISNIFGYILNYIYELVGNYGVAILLFTFLAKLVLVPLTYFQQKGMKKTAIISQKVKEVQEKHKGNEKKIQEETMQIYKDNNTSPLASCSSCITVIIQMILVLAMFYLVSEPLKYMRKMDPELYKQYEIRMYKEVIAEKEEKEEKEADIKEEEEQEKKELEETEEKEELAEENSEEEKTDEQIIRELKMKSGILRPQMEIIARYRDEDEIFNINTKFLDLELTQIPTNSLKGFNIKDKDTYIVLVNLIIPILYIGISIVNIIHTNKKTQKEKEKQDSDVIVLQAEKLDKTIKVKDKTEENKELEKTEKEELTNKVQDEKLNAEDIGDAMKDANKSMVYFLPLVMFSVTMSAPLSLALYWLTNTLLSFIEKTIIDKIVSREETVEIESKTAVKVKKDKKK